VTFRCRSFTAALVVLAAGVSVSAAWADAPQITVPSSGIDWSAGTVTVSADYPAGTQSVVFSAIGQTIATVVVADDTIAGTVSSGVPFPLTTPTDFSADARDAQNASIGVAMLELTPAMYRPSAPELELAAGTVVDFSLALKAVSDHTVTSVVVKTEPEPLTHPVTLVTGADGQIAVSGVRVPYGVETDRAHRAQRLWLVVTVESRDRLQSRATVEAARALALRPRRQAFDDSLLRARATSRQALRHRHRYALDTHAQRLLRDRRRTAGLGPLGCPAPPAVQSLRLAA